MKTKPKIAIYSGEIPSTTFIERLILGLSNNGYEILLFGQIKKNITYNQSVLNKGYKSGKLQKAVYLIYYSVLLMLFRNKDKRKLDQILKSRSNVRLYDKVKCYPVLWHKPDVFHIQWAKGLEDWIWVQEFGIKIIQSLRGAHINYSPIADPVLASMYKTYFPKVDDFHAVSKAIGVEAEKYGASKEKITVVYSGLQFEERITRKKQNKIFQIISIGRPHWIKGYTYALDACKLLKDQGFQFHYTIVGGTGDIEFAYQVHDLDITNEVSLTNQRPFKQVQELIQEADLLVLPSVKEGIANVVLEAMSLNTMVLTTDCGGVSEVIKNGENGFIIPIRDSKKMADKIIDIANISQEKEDFITTNALKTIKKQHSEQQMVEAMIELYQKV